MGTPYDSRYVAGEGAIPADACLIGEGPGFEENRTGIPFQGKAGRLLTKLLENEGIGRDALWITNVVKYQVPGNADPTKEDIERDAPDLSEELRAVQPKYIGLLGAVAVKQFLPRDVNLEWGHGLPFAQKDKSTLGQTTTITFLPIYHPALGLHSPDTLPLIESDIHQFARLVKGRMSEEELRGRRDECPRPKYRELTDRHIEHIKYLTEGRTDRPIAIDTEGWWQDPWGLSFSDLPGRAFVIRAIHKKAIRAFVRGLKKSERKVILHNSLHDLEVLSALGVEIGDNFVDTMVNAYHLCVEPQGLKPLSRRYCGMKQASYEDVLGAASKRKAIEYLRKVRVWASKHQQAQSQ